LLFSNSNYKDTREKKQNATMPVTFSPPLRYYITNCYLTHNPHAWICHPHLCTFLIAHNHRVVWHLSIPHNRIFLSLSIFWIALVLFPLVTVHDSEISIPIYDLNPFLTTVPERLSLRYGKQKLRSGNWSSVLIINGVQVRKCLSGEHGNGGLVLPPYFCFIIRSYFHARGVTFYDCIY